MTIAKRRTIIALFLVAFFFQSYASLSTKSATFDEVQFFGVGKYLLLNHKWDIMGAILHPPLSSYVSSLPLLIVSEDKKFWEYEEKNRDIAFLSSLDFLRGQGFLMSAQNANDRLLIASRLMILLLSLPLGYYIYRFSSELYGVKGGFLSLSMFTFCPNMIAFSGIAGPDMLLALFSFISIYYFRAFLMQQNLGTAFTAAVPLGLALATKFTALLLLPLQLLNYVAFTVKEKRRPSGLVLIIAGFALFIFFTFYFFKLTPVIQGVELVLLQMNKGQAAFLHGVHSNLGWWYFYPTVFLLKTPIPILLLFVSAIVLTLRKWRVYWLDAVFLCLPIVMLFVVFCGSNFSVGMRYLLPIYPFIFVVIGRVAECRSRIIQVLILAMLLWHISSSLNVAPHYLTYFNELIGGPKNGYKYLVDSNLDWGQDLKGLKRYMVTNKINKISLSYFGADVPQRYGIAYDWLPSHYLANLNPGKPVNILANRFLAISATNLQGVYFKDRDEFKWLRKYEPIAKIGYSIFIYDLNDYVRDQLQSP